MGKSKHNLKHENVTIYKQKTNNKMLTLLREQTKHNFKSENGQ